MSASSRGARAPAGGASIDRAEVTAVSSEGCEEFAGPGCQLATLRLTSGVHTGKRSYISLPREEAAPTVVTGDSIRVARNVPGGIDPKLAEQLPIDDASQQPYAFVDFERQNVLLWLVVPAILNVSPALLVALVGSMAVMLVTMVLSHGDGTQERGRDPGRASCSP